MLGCVVENDGMAGYICDSVLVFIGSKIYHSHLGVARKAEHPFQNLRHKKQLEANQSVMGREREREREE
jgi:hypothetical protein